MADHIRTGRYSATEVVDIFADSDSENDYFQLNLSDSDVESSGAQNTMILSHKKLQVMTQTMRNLLKFILIWICCLQTKYVFFPLLLC